MEILWHLKFAETQTRPDAAFKHKDPRFPNECEMLYYIISADHLQCKMQKKMPVLAWKTTKKNPENFPGFLKYGAKHWAKGCLSLFNYFIDKKPELMSPFFVEKTCFCLKKHGFFWQKMDFLTQVSCL